MSTALKKLVYEQCDAHGVLWVTKAIVNTTDDKTRLYYREWIDEHGQHEKAKEELKSSVDEISAEVEKNKSRWAFVMTMVARIGIDKLWASRRK